MNYPSTPSHLELVKRREISSSSSERYFQIYKDDIACILIEPIQAEGGDRHCLQFHEAFD